MSNKALVFKQIPQGYPVPGQDLTIEAAAYDANVAAPDNGVVLQSLYTSYDPYMRGRMRPAEVKSYAPAFALDKPIESASIAKVVRSNNATYKEGDLVIGHVAVQEYIALDAPNLVRIRKLENPPRH
ncbi:hypothetical protein N7533_006017 [Penicillium manginii]|uniref:uncharacterized protein n=1 Tax=Penicillium manginii TaxID=203109 RepID=UPI00254822AC|nr:uncharacterized protein N7533_006017 [Penicillium manginii]KAJ5756474.1 hypothetical protein N7533_006017 [Penicillium manginii]